MHFKITAKNRCWKRNLNTQVAYYRMGSWRSSMAFYGLPLILERFCVPSSVIKLGRLGWSPRDLETMRSDLETVNSGFGNYDLETVI
jgi:hypothetical protein